MSGGAVLTCGHDGCGCAVRIEAGCNCSGGGDSYTCICGAPLVAKAA
ncbi:MAG TPA: metallothionein [Candidatus Dormibacteraeota bacterium]